MSVFAHIHPSYRKLLHDKIKKPFVAVNNLKKYFHQLGLLDAITIVEGTVVKQISARTFKKNATLKVKSHVLTDLEQIIIEEKGTDKANTASWLYCYLFQNIHFSNKELSMFVKTNGQRFNPNAKSRKWSAERKKKSQIRRSNNPQNRNKNICALRVAEAIGVDTKTEYLHTISELIDAAKAKYNVTIDTDRKEVGFVASALRVRAKQWPNLIGAIVYVKRHVLLYNTAGRVWVDTAPSKSSHNGWDQRIARKVIYLYEKT